MTIKRESLLASHAEFSPCRRWRYSLTRHGWPGGRGRITFVGLNPSTADEKTDDPTIRRCIRFARDLGYARLDMVNLYAWRSTDPKALWLAEDPVGPENDDVLRTKFGRSDLIVAAWGVNARPDRLAEFARTFGGWPFHALGTTKDGAPRHPLYMRADSIPVTYDLGTLRAAA